MYTYRYRYIDIDIDTYVCMYVCMYVCIYIYIYIYVERERHMYLLPARSGGRDPPRYVNGRRAGSRVAGGRVEAAAGAEEQLRSMSTP